MSEKKVYVFDPDEVQGDLFDAVEVSSADIDEIRSMSNNNIVMFLDGEDIGEYMGDIAVLTKKGNSTTLILDSDFGELDEAIQDALKLFGDKVSVVNGCFNEERKKIVDTVKDLLKSQEEPELPLSFDNSNLPSSEILKLNKGNRRVMWDYISINGGREIPADEILEHVDGLKQRSLYQSIVKFNSMLVDYGYKIDTIKRGYGANKKTFYNLLQISNNPKIQIPDNNIASNVKNGENSKAQDKSRRSSLGISFSKSGDAIFGRKTIALSPDQSLCLGILVNAYSPDSLIGGVMIYKKMNGIGMQRRLRDTGGVELEIRTLIRELNTIMENSDIGYHIRIHEYGYRIERNK